MRDEHRHERDATPREKLHALAVGMLDSCRQSLRIATEMQDQPLVGWYAEQERKLIALVEAVTP